MFLKITFEDDGELECDIQEIRQLIDENEEEQLS